MPEELALGPTHSNNCGNGVFFDVKAKLPVALLEMHVFGNRPGTVLNIYTCGQRSSVGNETFAQPWRCIGAAPCVKAGESIKIKLEPFLLSQDQIYGFLLHSVGGVRYSSASRRTMLASSQLVEVYSGHYTSERQAPFRPSAQWRTICGRLVVDHGHVLSLFTDMEQIAADGSHADVFLCAKDGCRIPAHRALLRIRCPALEEMVEETEGETAVIRMDDFDVNVNALRRFVLFMYTDRLESKYCEAGDAQNLPIISDSVSLMVVARSLVGSLENGFLPTARQVNRATAAHRLQHLCEKHIHSLLSLDTVPEILAHSLRIGHKPLMHETYMFLAQTKPGDNVVFVGRLCAAVKEVTNSVEHLAVAIAAMSGKVPDVGDVALSKEIPGRLSEDLEVLYLDCIGEGGSNGLTDCFLIVPGMQSDVAVAKSSTEPNHKKRKSDELSESTSAANEPCISVPAHRFMLAARSKYFAAKFRWTEMAGTAETKRDNVEIISQPPPSLEGLQTLVRFIYTARLAAEDGVVDAVVATEVLSMLDYSGGQNFLQMSDHDVLRDGAISWVKKLCDGPQAWATLRRSLLNRNLEVQRLALGAVVKQCQSVDDESAIKKRKLWMPSSQEPWWTLEMQNHLLEEILISVLSSTTPRT